VTREKLAISGSWEEMRSVDGNQSAFVDEVGVLGRVRKQRRKSRGTELQINTTVYFEKKVQSRVAELSRTQWGTHQESWD
jgi:hypothetical protein